MGAKTQHQPRPVRPTAHFFAVATMTICSLAVYGVLQERVMTIPYEKDPGGEWTWGRVLTSFRRRGVVDPVVNDAAFQAAVGDDVRFVDDDLFTCSMFLVFVNRWMALVVSTALYLFTGNLSAKHMRQNAQDYAAVSFSNLVATACQYEVLKYLTFSVSTLAKTMKVVPVMIWGQFLGNKKFTTREYFQATLITFGCFVFVANRGWKSAVQQRILDDDAMEWAANAGFLILGIYFVFDGFTSSFQQRMFGREGITLVSVVLFTSFFTTVFCFIWLFVTDQLNYSVGYVLDHPSIFADVVLLSATSTAAQFSIAYTVKCYGAVTLASIMTFRQFISVVISCYLFGAALNIIQWFGILLILAPLAFQRVQFHQTAATAEDKNAPLTRDECARLTDDVERTGFKQHDDGNHTSGFRPSRIYEAA